MSDPDFEGLAERTLSVYEQYADRWDAERPRHMLEVKWLERFVDGFGPGASVLDLGCGTGDPIATWLDAQGYRVTGADGAQAMITLAESRRPDMEWIVADMRSLDLDRRFDGIVAWDSFFHLTGDEQRETLDRLSAHLEPEGALLLTVGPEAGEADGWVCGERVYHASLDPSEYAELLSRSGLVVTHFVAEDPDCDHHTVLLARRGQGR